MNLLMVELENLSVSRMFEPETTFQPPKISQKEKRQKELNVAHFCTFSVRTETNI